MLKTQRIRAGFSQDFMADWLNISRKKFNEFENGKFDFELMVMYADKFSIKINISYQ
jgi:DNA-binding XRE family transcriptional regulator